MNRDQSDFLEDILENWKEYHGYVRQRVEFRDGRVMHLVKPATTMSHLPLEN